MGGVEGLMFDDTFGRLEKALNETSRRQAIIAYNIANANTPGFTPLRFEDELEKAQKKYETPEEGSLQKKGVVIEEEMARLADNTLR